MKWNYLDSVTASVERLMKARRSMNIGVFVSIIFITLFLLMGIGYQATEDKFYLLCYTLCILYTIIFIGMIIKREIYSMMIYLKKDEGGKKHE